MNWFVLVLGLLVSSEGPEVERAIAKTRKGTERESSWEWSCLGQEFCKGHYEWLRVGIST